MGKKKTRRSTTPGSTIAGAAESYVNQMIAYVDRAISKQNVDPVAEVYIQTLARIHQKTTQCSIRLEDKDADWLTKPQGEEEYKEQIQ